MVKMSKIIEISNLSKSYKDFSVRNLNLTLEKGYIMGFIGPNGAGKSTTIKLIMNLIKKDSGIIKIFGLDNATNDIAIKERIGFVYDENHFYEELTVSEMTKMIRPFYSRWDEDVFQRYIQEFDLPLQKKIKLLSKGMKMKFSLAIALSHHAELLIMDEPTSGLDPLVRRELLDILQSIMSDGQKSVFFSTHITSDLDKIADYITLINEGEIVFCKTKDELLEDYCIVKGNKTLLETHPIPNAIGIHEQQYGFEALSSNRTEIIKQFGDTVLIEKPTLEDIMVFFTRKENNHVSSH